jgi:hypothetical protein
MKGFDVMERREEIAAPRLIATYSLFSKHRSASSAGNCLHWTRATP